MTDNHDRNRAEQRAARALMKELDIKYTHALRLIREAKAREENMSYNEPPGIEPG